MKPEPRRRIWARRNNLHKYVRFPGTAWLSRASALAGVTNVDRWTLAFKIRGFSMAQMALLRSDDSGADYTVGCDMFYGGLLVSGMEPTATTGLVTTAQGLQLAGGKEWGDDVPCTFQIAYRNNAGARAFRWWVNGEERPTDAWGGLTWLALGAINLSTVATGWRIGRTPGGTFPLVADLGFVWFGAGNSDTWHVTDPRKFYDRGDVDLGANGELPAGTAPLIFFGGQQTPAQWNAGTNLGTGGAFVMNGAVVDATT